MATTLSAPALAASGQPAAGVGHGRTVLLGLGFCAALCVAGLFVPKWLTFLVTMAAANGLVSLGIVGLMLEYALIKLATAFTFEEVKS